LYNRPEVAAVPRDLVPPHKKKLKPRENAVYWGVMLCSPVEACEVFGVIYYIHLQGQIIVTDLLKAFLGNGSVNTFQPATIEDVSQ
jgi:hypothetical protein